MSVRVLVVVPVRQLAELRIESRAAGVLLSRRAPAIAPPVAERFNDVAQLWAVGEHRPALPHRDLVRGIEADRRDIAERADLLAVVRRAHRVAAILHEPEVVFFRARSDRGEVERVAECVRDHDCTRSRPDGFLEPGDVDVVGRNGHVEKDRDEAVLHDRVHRRRETGGDGDHLVARHQPAIAELRGGERGQREQVRARAGVHQRTLAHTDEAWKLPLELVGEAPCGEPEVQRGVDEMLEFVRVEHHATYRHRVLAWPKSIAVKCEAMVVRREPADFVAEFFLGSLGHE